VYVFLCESVRNGQSPWTWSHSDSLRDALTEDMGSKSAPARLVTGPQYPAARLVNAAPKKTMLTIVID
jgi:hypothetical protein